MGRRVRHKEKEGMLKEIILKVEDQGERLFMAAEQGSGGGKNNVQLTLNPNKKFKSNPCTLTPNSLQKSSQANSISAASTVQTAKDNSTISA